MRPQNEPQTEIPALDETGQTKYGCRWKDATAHMLGWCEFIKISPLSSLLAERKGGGKKQYRNRVVDQEFPSVLVHQEESDRPPASQPPSSSNGIALIKGWGSCCEFGSRNFVLMDCVRLDGMKVLGKKENAVARMLPGWITWAWSDLWAIYLLDP